MNIESYPKVRSYYDKCVRPLFEKGSVVEIQEKIDGSQISFGWGPAGLWVRSRRADAFGNAMFSEAIEHLRSHEDRLFPGCVYRGEYLRKPKHNVLAYGRVPRGHIALFDVQRDCSGVASLSCHSDDLNIEKVKTLYVGPALSPEQIIERFMDMESQLGGCKIEGVVVKPAKRDLFFSDGKPMVAKIVSDRFREKKKRKVSPRTGVEHQIADALSTEARWQKALAHLREEGKLTGSMRDVGPLMREVNLDILEEEEDWIKGKLFKSYWGQISRAVTRGLPDWYRSILIQSTEAKAKAT